MNSRHASACRRIAGMKLLNSRETTLKGDKFQHCTRNYRACVIGSVSEFSSGFRI